MFVGAARLVLQIPGARSLKDRRQVVRSFKDRARARLPVSVAEVGDVERWQVATIGVSTVSSSRARCDEILGAAVQMAGSLPEAILADVRRETFSFGPGGNALSSGIESHGSGDAGPGGEEEEDS